MRFYWLVLIVLLLTQGTALAHPGSHEQLRRLSLAIEQQPAEQGLYLKRGALYLASESLQEAAADFTHAEALGPAVLVAYDWALYYHQTGNLQRAHTYLNQYLKQFPRSAQAYQARARVALSLKDYPLAAADLQRHIELHPQPHPGSYIAAANILQEIGQNEEALQLIDSGLNNLGLTPQLQRKAVALEMNRGDLKAAISRLETLRIPLKDNPNWKFEMAELLVLDEQPQPARKLLERLLLQLDSLRANPARETLRLNAMKLRQSLTTSSPRN